MQRLLLLVACVVAAVLAGTEVPLVRVAHYEPVLNFQVNSARDQLTFNAYGKSWTFEIWLSGVQVNNQYHFNGRLANGPKTSNAASFTLMPNHITGMIVLANETFWLEAKHYEDPSALFIYRTSDVWFHPSVSTLQCKSGLHNGNINNNHHNHHNKHNTRDPRTSFSVAVYKDQYWAEPINNPWASDDQTMGLLNDVNLVYSNAQAGLFPFVYTILGTRNNQWTTNDALNNMLTDISKYSETNILNYDLVSWLVGNNVGGLAWVGSACGTYGAHYRGSVSGLANFSRLWTVKTIAHELGHNRGAPHDFDNQCAQNQNVGCQCSVMSYCFPNDQTAGGANNYFSDPSKAAISTLQSQCPTV